MCPPPHTHTEAGGLAWPPSPRETPRGDSARPGTATPRSRSPAVPENHSPAPGAGVQCQIRIQKPLCVPRSSSGLSGPHPSPSPALPLTEVGARLEAGRRPLVGAGRRATPDRACPRALLGLAAPVLHVCPVVKWADCARPGHSGSVTWTRAVPPVPPGTQALLSIEEHVPCTSAPELG